METGQRDSNFLGQNATGKFEKDVVLHVHAGMEHRERSGVCGRWTGVREARIRHAGGEKGDELERSILASQWREKIER